MATSRIAESVGRVLGDRYRLTRPLGVGASANVFAAEDVKLRRRVAVKVLHPALAGEEAFLRRFRAEARAVASLRHPNILRVYDWGEDGGSPYLVMELLEGGSLRALLDRGARLSTAQAAAVGADAARALDYAHRQGLVHRDVKPANLIFDDEGRVSVADFGLARALAEATWTEPAGAVVGTARYAAPELVRGEHLDSKADVYSLALVLVEAVTGAVPFASDTAFGTLMARVGRPLPVPDDLGPLKPVLEAAGSADPATRLDAAALAASLAEAARGLVPPAPLPLAGPLQSGVLERDDVSPTEYPGRPKLFDAAEWEDERPDPDGTPPEAAGAGAAAAAGAGAVAGAEGLTPPRDRPRDGAAERVATAGAGRSVAPGASRSDPAVAGGGRDGGETDAAGPARRSRRRRVILAGLAALVLAGAGGGAWAVESGNFTPQHPVPQLLGLTQAAAVSDLGRIHLHLGVTGSTYSARYPAGEIISQVPSSGKLREGRTVGVVLSAGPQPIAVPASLAGDTQQTAEQVLSTLHLRTGTVTQSHSMTVPAGVVISSSPDSGTLLPGQPVDLVVSSGKPSVPVPALTPTSGASFASARSALTSAGLGAVESDEYSTTVPQGQVIALDPGPSTSVVVGTNVTVVVSKGPHLVAVPGVAGQSVGAAAQNLNSAGFTVKGVSGNPLGTVTGTSPAGGTQVLYGSAVTIITG